MLRIFLLRIFVLFMLFAPGKGVAAGNVNNDFQVKHDSFKLDNGLEVFVVPNNKVPVITQMVWYKVGAIDEKYGKSGIAHFLEHLMFKATKNHKTGEFSKIVSGSGGNDNAFTDTDYTSYHQVFPKTSLEQMIALEADRMQNLLFNEEEVLKERDVILEERRMRIDNNPKSQLFEQMKAALYLNHPYRRPLIGWYHEIAGLTVKDAKEWYENYYNPANAILVYSGDIDINQLKVLTEKYFGRIKSGKPHIRDNLVIEPEHIAARRITYANHKVMKEELSRFYLAPNITSKDKDKIYAINLLSYILGGTQTSILYRDLVVKQKLAVSAATYYDEMKLGPVIFSVNLIPSDKVSLVLLEQALDKILLDLINNGVKAEDLNKAKRAITAATIYSKEDLKTLANVYGATLALGLEASYIDNWDNNINKVTLEDIKAAAALVFNHKQSVTGYLTHGPSNDK